MSSAVSRRLRASTPAHHKPRDKIKPVDNHSSLQDLRHMPPCVLNLPLDECIVNTPTHSRSKEKEEKKKRRNSPKWSNAKEKQKRSFEASKAWSPKTWATARHNQAKRQASPQEEATGSTPLAKTAQNQPSGKFDTNWSSKSARYQLKYQNSSKVSGCLPLD